MLGNARFYCCLTMLLTSVYSLPAKSDETNIPCPIGPFDCGPPEEPAPLPIGPFEVAPEIDALQHIPNLENYIIYRDQNNAVTIEGNEELIEEVRKKMEGRNLESNRLYLVNPADIKSAIDVGKRADSQIFIYNRQ